MYTFRTKKEFLILAGREAEARFFRPLESAARHMHALEKNGNEIATTPREQKWPWVG